MSRLLVVLLVLMPFGAVGCSTPAPTPPSAQTVDVETEALKAVERSDWVPAARLLREAMTRNPSSLRLHFSLAIAATHLNLRDEAIREFQWVLSNAASSSEADVARKWLTEAGVLGAVAVETDSPSPAPTVEGATTVTGQVVWTDGEPPIPINRLQLFLKGLGGTKTQDEYFVLRTDEDGRFQFRHVPPGPYKLTNRIAGKPEWRLRVQIEPDREQTLTLDPQNSTRVRDDFPNDG